MDLRVLRYFVAIADAGSFTAAAARLCVAQPALSRHVRELETELGVTLVQRLPRGIRLTVEGAVLHESAVRMLEEAEQVRHRLSDREAPGQQRVTLGTSPTLGRVVVPALFERARRASGGLALRMREAFTPQLLDWLQRGLVDVAIVTNPDTDRPLALQPLAGEPFALICPAGQRRPAVVTPAQLSTIPVLMTRLHRGIVERQLGRLGARLNVQAEIDSVDSIRELVLRGRWATVMPVSVFSSDLGTPRAVTMSEVSGIPLSRILMLATRIEARQPMAIEVVKELVRNEFAELAAQGVFSIRAGGRVRRAKRSGR